MFDFLKRIVDNFVMSGLKIGDIDIGNQVIDNEFKIKYLTKILEWVMNNNSIKAPSAQELKEFKKSSIAELKVKYPNSGVEYKE